MLEINEPIDVIVLFKGNCIRPYRFLWRNRKIKVDQINLVHTSKNGNSLFYHFSVSSQANFYRLKFDTGKLRWILEAVEED